MSKKAYRALDPLVTTSSIRSRILKAKRGGRDVVDVVSHNIVDPFEDTERYQAALFGAVYHAVTTSSIRSRILKAAPPGARRPATKVTTSSIRSRILKAHRRQHEQEDRDIVTTSSIRSRILKVKCKSRGRCAVAESQHRRSVRGY